MARGRVISAVLTLKDKDFSANAKKATSVTKNMERELKHARNTVSNFGKTATSSFKSVATGAASIVGAIGITKAFSSAFNLVRNSLDSAFARIDTMEQFDRVMTTMLGSTEAANKALEDTSAIVKGTAYGLNTAAGAVQQFATSGTSIDKATGYVSAFSDAVAFYGDGTDETFSRVSRAMAEMATSGTASLGSIRTLTEANIPVFQIYADATGRSAEEVQKSLEKGEISAEHFLDTLTGAMMEGTDKFASIQGAAKEAGASWSGSFANMRAAVTRGTMGIINSIDEMLTKNGLPDMRGMIANFGSAFEGVLNKASEKVPVVTGYLVGLYEKSKPGIDWVKDTGLPAVREGIGFVTDKARDMYNFIKDNWSAIGPVVAGVTASIAALKAGIVIVTAAKTTWKAVTSAVQIATALLNGTLAISPLGWVAIAIGAVVAAGVLLWQNWDTVREKAGELWEKVKEVFGGIYSWGMEKIQPVVGFFQGLYDKFVSFRDAISSFTPPEWVSKIGGAISGAASKVMGFIQGSHATGLDRVPHDGYVAELHKGEMIIPARQSEQLRQQGVTKDNISNVVTGQKNNQTTTVPTTTTNNQTKNNNKIDIHIYAQNKTTREILSELVPELKLVLANM